MANKNLNENGLGDLEKDNQNQAKYGRSEEKQGQIKQGQSNYNSEKNVDKLNKSGSYGKNPDIDSSDYGDNSDLDSKY